MLWWRRKQPQPVGRRAGWRWGQQGSWNWTGQCHWQVGAHSVGLAALWGISRWVQTGCCCCSLWPWCTAGAWEGHVCIAAMWMGFPWCCVSGGTGGRGLPALQCVHTQ
jgi:hypothetical protein